MTQVKPNKKRNHYKYVACTFQGGGALGAYQAGVLRALDEEGYYPNWFVGTSIGAINAAIAAGNPEKVRIEKLYEFWESIASPPNIIETMLPDDLNSRKLYHLFSSQSSLLTGQPGFFAPRFPPPELGWHDTPDLLSYYDTSPLQATLEKFVDFDRINSKKITRLSVGAVEISSGALVYFDSHEQKIGPEHIMASGALPPGFPAIKIGDSYYWDGGISNNTPIAHVLLNQDQQHLLCFMVNLFDSYGLHPTTLDEVIKRKKDIEFSSKFNRMIQITQQVQALKNSIHLLSKYVPEDQKSNPELKLCMARGHSATLSLVQFLYDRDDSELSSKDYEFSMKSIKERLKFGYRDAKKAIKKSPWLEPVPATQGIALHDMTNNHYDKESKK